MSFIQIACAVAVPLLWGFQFVVIKVGVLEFPPLFFLALRFLAIALLLVPFVKQPTRQQFGPVAAISVFLGGLNFGLFYVGLGLGSGSMSAVAYQLATPFTVLLAWPLLAEKPSLTTSAGVLLAFVGVVVLFPVDLDPADFADYPDTYGNITLAIILFAAFVGPEVLIPDRRNGMLALYLSTPLDRRTYLAAKGIATGLILGLVTLATGIARESQETVGGSATIYKDDDSPVTAARRWAYRAAPPRERCVRRRRTGAPGSGGCPTWRAPGAPGSTRQPPVTPGRRGRRCGGGPTPPPPGTPPWPPRRRRDP